MFSLTHFAILFVILPFDNCNEIGLQKLYKLFQDQQKLFQNQQKLFQNQQEEITELKSTIRQLQNHETKGEVKPGINKRLLLDDPSHLQFEIDKMKATLSTITATKGGAIYVRWGRSICPSNGTEMVYAGYAGGSLYSHSGAAADYLCLPKDPTLGKQIPSAGAYIYGAEYERTDFGPARNQDVPCVVCRSTSAISTIMIPGKNNCYPEWKQEYSGRLAAGAYGHAAATMYTCMDEQPEVLTGGEADQDGKLFYTVSAQCGSLPCPPYHTGAEILCVVCSK